MTETKADKAPAATQAAAPATVEIKLDYPVTWKDKTIDTLVFRRRKARDLVAMDAVKGDMAKTFALYASMCGQPLPVIEEIDGDDMDRIMELTLPLMGKTAAAAKVADQESQAALH